MNIMKKTNPTGFPLRALLLMGVILLFSHPIYGQDANDVTLSLNLQNATLEEFTRKVETATGFSFVYSEEVKLARPITLKVSKQPLQKVLEQAFTGQPVTYQITGKHILLRKKQEKPVKRKHTISGYVTDGTSSETLIGANILESRQHQGTATNPYGFYSLTLPEGETTLHFSYLGYTTRQLNLALTRDTVLNIRLESNNLLEEVVVLSNKVEAGIKATQMSAIDIPMAQIRHTPSIVEADVMKTVQLIPGVQSGIEGSAGLYVRGGGPDQNLILLDGIPVYNVDHLFGFFSVFTPEAIKKVTLFKGSFPARFGGRLSSVVDIRTNDGDMKKFHGILSIGLLTSKLQFEGPIIKDRTSFNISARRSYLDLIARPLMEKEAKMWYYFYDMNAKINHKFSDRSRLYLSFYNGIDHYSASNEEEYGADRPTSTDLNKWKIGWGNTIVSGRWNYIFNNKLFSNTTLAYNSYQMKTNTLREQRNYDDKTIDYKYQSDYRSGINDWSWQTDFDYTPNPKHNIKFGAGYTHHTFKPEVSTASFTQKENDKQVYDSIYSNIANDPIMVHEATAYVEDNFELLPKVNMNAGVHLSLFNVQKKTYFSIQPRISLRYQVHKDIALKAAYTKMNQYVQLLTSAPFSMPTDLWVPVTGDIKPMQAHQFSVGAYYTGIHGWEFSAELYYKYMKNVLEYKDGTTFFGTSDSWDKKVEMGTGRSGGLELMVQKTTGKTTGWIGYTLARHDRQFKNGSINDGRSFPYKYDRRHNLAVVINHTFSQRIDVGASWTFNTGGTTTIPTETTSIIHPWNSPYSTETSETGYIESRNNYRLPSSHRLNVGINFNKKTKHGMRTWNISLYNTYNAMNPNFVYYEPGKTVRKYSSEEGEWVDVFIKPHIAKWTILPCIPSVTYTYKF